VLLEGIPKAPATRDHRPMTRDVVRVDAAGAGEAHAVRHAAEEHVRGRRKRGSLAVALGVVAFAGGIAGFGVYGARSDQLAKHGVHTTAVVTAMHTGVPFDDYLLVGFPTPEAYEQSVHVRAGDRLRLSYRVGQSVAIVYDPSNPRRAQLEHGSDIGPIGLPFALALFVGAALVVLGARTLALCRAARRALRTRPRPMLAASSVNRRTGRMIHLIGDHDWAAVRSVRRRDWWGPELRLDGAGPLDVLLPVAVFRDPKHRRVIVVADGAARGAAVGREVREPRLLRLLLPRALRGGQPRDAFGSLERRTTQRS
jgi:hypothetical protein